MQSCRGKLRARYDVSRDQQHLHFYTDITSVLKDCILTTEDIHESYFVLAMQKAYDEAASITGEYYNLVEILLDLC